MRGVSSYDAFFASYDAFFASYDALLPHMISYDVGPFLVHFFHVCLSEVFCFFFPSFGSVSPALASGYCTILGGTFTVPRFPRVVVGGALLQDLIFSRSPFARPCLVELLFQGPCKALLQGHRCR